MLMAWPNAEIFKGDKLKPTVLFWHRCLSDIDFCVAQQAVVDLCKTSKFPPSIAEFRKCAEEVADRLQEELGLAWNLLCADLRRGRTLGEMYRDMADGSNVKRTIDIMGGPERIYTGHDYGPYVTRSDDGRQVFSYVNFERAYKKGVYALTVPMPQIEVGSGGKQAIERR